MNSKQTTHLRFFIHLYTSTYYFHIYICLCIYTVYIYTYIHLYTYIIYLYIVRVQCTINPHLLLQQLKCFDQRTDFVGSLALRRSAMVPARKQTWPTYWMMQPEAKANLTVTMSEQSHAVGYFITSRAQNIFCWCCLNSLQPSLWSKQLLSGAALFSQGIAQLIILALMNWLQDHSGPHDPDVSSFEDNAATCSNLKHEKTHSDALKIMRSVEKPLESLNFSRMPRVYCPARQTGSMTSVAVLGSGGWHDFFSVPKHVNASM